MNYMTSSSLLMALFYNAILAFVNANVMAVNFYHAAVAELVVIFIGLFVVVRYVRFDGWTKVVLLFLVLFLANYIWNSLLAFLSGEGLSMKPARDVIIIFSFLLLGYCAAQKSFNINLLVVFAATITLVFLLLEYFSTAAYIKLFNVSSYYSNTRGLSDSVSMLRAESGLFFTAASFEGRFTFGFRAAQRLSSLFLEQTTHGNFAVILMIYLVAFWRAIGARSRAVILVTIFFIIAGTDSRQAFGIGLVILLLCAFSFALKKRIMYYYIPLMIFMMAVFFYDSDAGVGLQSDNIVGRMTYSISALLNSGFDVFFGAKLATNVFDSGYAYLLHSQSIFGLLAFWIFLCKILPGESKTARLFSHSVMLFYTLNLAVSGSTIFSIKTSALLWFIVGYVCFVDRHWLRSAKVCTDKTAVHSVLRHKPRVNVG